MCLFEVLCATHSAIGSSKAHLRAGIRRLGVFLIVRFRGHSTGPSCRWCRRRPPELRTRGGETNVRVRDTDSPRRSILRKRKTSHASGDGLLSAMLYGS